MTYEDDIALLADDIRRYCNNDGRIDEALTQLLKLHQAEVDALAFEALDLDRLTTAVETERIERLRHQQTVRWVGRDGSET